MSDRVPERGAAPMNNHQSRALLITGASRGIGRAIALVAAQRGWSVGVNYREDELAAGVANVGVGAPTARLVEMTAERMRRVCDVNVLGAYFTAREAARRMCE